MTINMFEAAVSKIGKTDGGNLFKELSDVFKAVTNFNDNDAVASYQALSYMSVLYNDADGVRLIEALRNAIISHMDHLVAEQNFIYGAHGGVRMRNRFDSVVKPQNNTSPNSKGEYAEVVRPEVKRIA